MTTFLQYIWLLQNTYYNKDGNYYPEIYVRLNRKGQNSAFIPINLWERTLHVHYDENVDLVIFLFYPSQDIFDYLYILTSYLPTRESIDKMLNEGDDVFYSALFTNYYGKENNHPILRFGKVSLLTNEKIEINQINEPEKLAHLYLFEIQSYPGNMELPYFFNSQE